MNFFDYLFTESKALQKSFLLGAKEQITFPELYADSLKLAAHLQNKIGTGKNVLLISPNNLFFIKSYLAILKSGNTVVPLNPGIETENLNYILTICETDIAFLANNARVSSPLLQKVFNEKEVQDLLENDIEFKEADFSSETLAQIIFTSGSTGSPKGVRLSHKNLIANTTSILQYLQLTSKDTMLVVLPFSYCYGLSLLHTHLKVGGSIVFNNSFIFLGGILRDLNLYECTGFAGVPSHYQVLLRKSKSFVTSTFPTLRYVTQAGGKLTPVFIKEFTDAFPSIKFFVMYGQTEATARLSYLPYEYLQTKLGSIGKGIPGVTLKVVNETGKEVAPDEVGEIVAYGDNIMQGYYKDEALTSETIKDGWLHTGDLATVDKDGFIFVVSRKKEFIKVRGKRVSPREIEDVILMLPDVVDCTIVGVEDALLGEALKASIVLNDNARNSVTVDDIMNHCHKYLSKYKIPSQYEFSTSMNISVTGKKVKSTL